jgi:hypothetical protein
VPAEHKVALAETSQLQYAAAMSLALAACFLLENHP